MYTMADVRNQQIENAVLMADAAGGADMEVPDMNEGPPAETRNGSGELVAEQTGADVPIVLYLGHLLLRALALLSMLRNSDHNESASKSGQSCPAFLLRILAIFSCCSGDNKSVTVPRSAGYLADEIEEFIPVVRRFYRNIYGQELSELEENDHRRLYSDWNTFLQPVPGERSSSAILSSHVKGDISEFTTWQEERRGAECTICNKTWIKRWLPRWNMFLQARAGETLVTRMNLFLTIVGFIFYIVDLVSDVGTSMYYVSNGQWWRALVTLALVYGAVIIHTGWKWIDGQVPCTGAAAWIRYVASLLVNWPDVQHYGALCLLEWRMYRSPAGTARLVTEWYGRKVRVAFLKYTEGVWEACPQAMLQLCLLVPDLYGDWTRTAYLRIAGASVSLCTAGAAFVNMEKCDRIHNHSDVPLRELVVLHVWAVPVTVARLVSLTLLLTVHPYWALAGVALHLALPGAYWCGSVGGPRTLTGVIAICQLTLQFCISPFNVGGSVTARRVRHAIHVLGNTAATVVWALGTPLVCAHPALYTAIIGFNAVMFAVGVGAWQLHETKWRR